MTAADTRDLQQKAHSSNLATMGIFARLPGELRNRVYRLALVEPDGPFMIVAKSTSCSRGPCSHQKLPVVLPGILSACQQMRYEAMPIFFAENSFKFDARTVSQRCTANLLRAIHSSARLITRVILEIFVSSRDMTIAEYTEIRRPYELRIDCASTPQPHFRVESDMAISTRVREIAAVMLHSARLDVRAKAGEKMEKLLLEFVWSDILADLCFACSKRPR